MNTNKTILNLLAGVAMLVGATGMFAATVTTDREDYPPGSTAIITGTGFQPGETVELQVLRIDINENSGPEHNPWQVTADAAGGLITTWYVAPDEEGATLQLTATGLTSGLTAQHVFTDGPVTPTLGTQSGSLTYGSTQTATFTVTLSKTGGNNAAVNLVLLGLPSGVTYRFSPNNFNTTVSTNSTLTITNGPTAPAGTYSITVTNSGEATFGTGTLTIGKAATTGTLVSSSPSVLPGNSVRFTNTLSAVAPGAGTPTGTVQFRTNGAAFGSPVALSGAVAISAVTSILPHGSNTVTAEYTGDANFTGVTNTLNPQQVVNAPPVARSVSSSVALGGVVAINFDLGKYKLATDADADPLKITSVFGATNASLGLAANGLSVTYTNTGGTSGTFDAFSFVVSDGFGGFATNTATVRLESPTGFNQLSVSGNTLNYVGIPGASYALENTALLSPASWAPVVTNAVGSDGRLIFNLGASPSGFYRTRYVSGP
jgi:hypothetical protein